MAKPNPICLLGCRCEMIAFQNGVPVKDKAVGEFPSTMWYGDAYTCPKCATIIVTGFSEGQVVDGATAAIEFKSR